MQTTTKILITTNIKPKRELFTFLKEFITVIPNSYYYPRKNYLL